MNNILEKQLCIGVVFLEENDELEAQEICSGLTKELSANVHTFPMESAGYHVNIKRRMLDKLRGVEFDGVIFYDPSEDLNMLSAFIGYMKTKPNGLVYYFGRELTSESDVLRAQTLLLEQMPDDEEITNLICIDSKPMHALCELLHVSLRAVMLPETTPVSAFIDMDVLCSTSPA